MTRSKLKGVFAFFSAACAVGIGAAAVAQGRGIPVVRTDRGLVRGATAADVDYFKGIPYALPPVGLLRWRAPQQVPAWSGIRDATAFGHDCVQLPAPGQAEQAGPGMSEDCLYLNLWRPAGVRRGRRLPVMVWIHGGAYINGSASLSLYDGSALARQGVILVSINYRLGRLGFFAHPALTAANADSGALGNYALMDQIAALRWVQANVAGFGGDPANVTIFGQSAGGLSVATLMASPMATGLFARAIVMSGGARYGAKGPVSVARAERTGQALARQFGVDGDDAKALDQLRSIPAERLAQSTSFAALFAPLPDGSMPAWGPVIDGHVLTGYFEDAMRAGAVARVSFMAGATTNDAAAPAEGDPFARFGPDADRARSLYATDPADAPRAIAVEGGMVEPTRLTVDLMQRQGIPAYFYRAGYVPAGKASAWVKGVPHGGEIALVFDNLAALDNPSNPVSAADRAASAQMSRYFVNFAKTGNPNDAGLPDWPAYEATRKSVMEFRQAGPVGGPDPLRARLDLLEAAADRATPSTH
ncbi:carboxylesterase/lipase family protein [soil metagenome]